MIMQRVLKAQELGMEVGDNRRWKIENSGG